MLTACTVVCQGRVGDHSSYADFLYDGFVDRRYRTGTALTYTEFLLALGAKLA
jgi:hypothetical protein